jgi:hypothetical protein
MKVAMYYISRHIVSHLVMVYKNLENQWYSALIVPKSDYILRHIKILDMPFSGIDL